MEFVDGEMASYQLSEELKQTKHLLSNNDKFPGIFSALGKAFYDCVFNCELCRCNKTTFYLVREQLLLIASKLFDESVISQADRLSFDGQETVKKLLEKMKDAEIYFETYTKEGFLNPLLIGHKSEQRINQIISDALIATNSIVELCGGSEVLEPPTEIKLHCDIKARIDNELGGLEGLVDNQESLGKVAAELECSAVDLAVEVKETLESIEQTLLYLDEEESGEGIVMTEEQKVQIKKEVKTLLHQKVAAVAAQYNDSVLNSALLAYPLKSSPKIFEEELLGEGAFSKIYKGKYNNAMVAVKVINDGVERELLNDLKREVLMQSKIKNVPGVLQLLGADLSSKHTNMIVMQLADGTLAGAVHRNDPAIDMSILSKLALLNQISAAMAHIEGFDMVHRDLTAENIFVLVQSRGRAVVKISNFAVPPKVSVTTAPAGVDPATVDVSQEAEVVSRTSAYTAPELFYKHRYSISSDVYAFAVIMNELLIEKIPFDGITESEKIMSLTIAGTRPDLYDADDLVGKKLRSLVRISWNHDKKKRPDFAQINRSLKQLLEKSKHTARRGVNTVNSTSFTEKLLGMDDEEVSFFGLIISFFKLFSLFYG